MITWILVFIGSLFAILYGADKLLDSAEKIGEYFRLPHFVIGVIIVGIGTSLPELASNAVAVWQGATEIVAANVIGSNIANILLVIGFAAVIGRGLSVEKNLIDLDLPLLAITTVLFVGTVLDGIVTRGESILLVVAYVIYLLYTLKNKEEVDDGHSVKDISLNDIAWLGVGVVGLWLGAKYLIESVIAISELTGFAVSAISLFAIALGTSLPELIVSIKAARNKKPEIALGNIFGSNVFNILMVMGLPGLFVALKVDEITLSLGLPIVIAATTLFVISGISKKIHVWDGALYLVLYVFFIGKVFAII